MLCKRSGISVRIISKYNYISNSEITVQVTKGYDLEIGQIVALDIDEEDISGNHRVQSKVITFGKTSSCTLGLNKKPILLKKYLS